MTTKLGSASSIPATPSPQKEKSLMPCRGGDADPNILPLKQCRRCLVVKDVSEFRKCATHQDGLQSYCGPCQTEVNRIWRLKDIEAHRALQRRAWQKHREKRLEQGRRWQKANREKYLAHNTVHRAILSGDLVRPDECERCGSHRFAIYAHHEDYSKRLEVTWLCGPCHQDRHREMATDRAWERAQ